MKLIRKYNAWATKHYVVLSISFTILGFALVAFISQIYGLQRLGESQTERGISVFGEQLFYILILHAVVGLFYRLFGRYGE